MKTYISPTNVNDQIEYICSFFKPDVEQKGMKISYKNSLPDKEAIIKTDKEKTYAILTNLVRNAIKFSDKGNIKLGYKLVKGDKAYLSSTFPELEFFVKDNGVGFQMTVWKLFLTGLFRPILEIKGLFREQDWDCRFRRHTLKCLGEKFGWKVKRLQLLFYPSQ